MAADIINTGCTAVRGRIQSIAVAKPIDNKAVFIEASTGNGNGLRLEIGQPVHAFRVLTELHSRHQFQNALKAAIRLPKALDVVALEYRFARTGCPHTTGIMHRRRDQQLWKCDVCGILASGRRLAFSSGTATGYHDGQ